MLPSLYGKDVEFGAFYPHSPRFYSLTCNAIYTCYLLINVVCMIKKNKKIDIEDDNKLYKEKSMINL